MKGEVEVLSAFSPMMRSAGTSSWGLPVLTGVGPVRGTVSHAAG